jgi:ribosomal protein L7/L12
MDIVWIILAAGLLALVLVTLFAKRLRGGERVRGDMIEQQRRQSGAPAPAIPRRLDGIDRNAAAAQALDPNTVPEIREAIAAGRKVEAIRMVRDRFGLDLKQAKELVERHS